MAFTPPRVFSFFDAVDYSGQGLAGIDWEVPTSTEPSSRGPLPPSLPLTSEILTHFDPATRSQLWAA